MKFLKLKKLTAALLAGVMVFSGTGCARTESEIISEDILADEQEEFKANKDSGTSNAEADSSMLNFAWWGSDKRHQYTIDALKIFEEQNPGISVVPTYSAFDSYEGYLAQSIASNSLPDVITVNYNWLYEYSKNGTIFADLNEYADELPLATYSDENLQVATIDGRIIGLPVATAVETFFYNKSIYDKYGLSVPKTFDDLFAAAEAMQADGVYPLTFGTKAGFILAVSYAEQLSGHKYMSLEGDIGFDKQDIENMLQFYSDLIEKNVCCRVESYDKSMINDGTTAGLMAWISDGAAWYDVISAGDSVVVGDYLSLDSATHPVWYLKPASLYCISEQSENKEAAVKLLKYLASSGDMMELQQTEKGIPACQEAQGYLLREGVLEDSIEYEAELKAEEYDNLQQMSYFMEDTDIVNLYWEAANAVSFGEKKADAAADELLSEINSLMESKR